MFKKYVTLILSVAMLFIALDGDAQPGNPTPCPDGSAPPCNGGPPPPPGRPIDGGLGLLLALGAAYGMKKIRKED